MIEQCTIGIDPDLKKSGVCILDKNGEIAFLLDCSITDLTKLIEDNKDLNFVIEDVLKSKTTYDSKIKSVRGKMRKAQNVGMVKGAASIIIEIITKITGKPPMLAPQGVGKQMKRNAGLFKSVTGYQGRTNEDKRDAYAVAYWGYCEINRGLKIDKNKKK